MIVDDLIKRQFELDKELKELDICIGDLEDVISGYERGDNPTGNNQYIPERKQVLSFYKSRYQITCNELDRVQKKIYDLNFLFL